jgi:hypothetical protein
MSTHVLRTVILRLASPATRLSIPIPRARLQTHTAIRAYQHQAHQQARLAHPLLPPIAIQTRTPFDTYHLSAPKHSAIDAIALFPFSGKKWNCIALLHVLGLCGYGVVMNRQYMEDLERKKEHRDRTIAYWKKRETSSLRNGVRSFWSRHLRSIARVILVGVSFAIFWGCGNSKRKNSIKGRSGE